MIKVSFDYDDTLDRQTVHDYAIELKERGIDVWICTNRPNDDDASTPHWNLDVHKSAREIGIPKRNIIYMNLTEKYKHFNGKDFLWHLDDSFDDADKISAHTNTKGIRYYSKGNWLEQCEKLL